MLRHATIAIALAGCWTKTPPPGSNNNASRASLPTISACERAISGAMSRILPTDPRDSASSTRNRSALRHADVTACIDDNWSPEVISCVQDAQTNDELKRCDSRLTPEQVGHRTEAIGLETAEWRLPTYASAAEQSNPDLPTECRNYALTMDKLTACGQAPQTSWDELKKAYDAMASGWKNVAGWSAAGKTALATRCTARKNAVERTGRQVCGW